MISLILKDGHEVKPSPGLHSKLIKEIVDVFGPIFAPDSKLWISDAPTHMVYFNGSRFLGPY